MINNLDSKVNLEELKKEVADFSTKRDWDQFHNAKELALALSIESSELLELFRWKTPEEVKEIMNDVSKKEEVKDELSDIFNFVLRIAQFYDIDLTSALRSKMKKNELKYPVDKFKGSNKKYNEDN
ncbi:MAG: nucleotide pyrophosphohydrolase [Nanoarchaeales archaeon]|nr:nucleotide pyrophosphohydrolase [Nanoarchaeales archaeon]